jgi:hypothetical protein
MPLPTPRPLNEQSITESTTSLATSPVAVSGIATASGYIERVMAAAGGTTTGTTNVAVSINGGADIAGGNLNIPAGTGARAGNVYELGMTGVNAVWINEGDQIAFTPSGGAGASIPGAFALVIRTIA